MTVDSPSLTLAGLGCGALLVRVGLGLYAAGTVRAKNAAGAVLRSALDLAVAVIAFWAIGSAIFNATGSVLGLEPGRIFDINGKLQIPQFVQMALILIGTAPVMGAVAERSRLFPMLAAPALLGGILIPVIGQWTWNNGWLADRGFFDSAGAGVLHLTGGLAALVAAIFVGPRSGKYNTDRSSNFIPGHSVPLASVGVLVIFAGWIPYTLAATALMTWSHDFIAFNVMLSAAAGALTAAILSHIRYGKPDVMLTLSGLLGALVAITGAGATCPTIGALVIGAVAGFIVPTLTVLIDLVWKIDDPSGGIAIHAAGGAWGTLAVGLFAGSTSWLNMFRNLAWQLIGLLVIAALTVLLTTLLFAFLRLFVRLRLSDDAEYDGADLAEHDINAYPDFQQTMIKSYHMREA